MKTANLLAAALTVLALAAGIAQAAAPATPSPEVSVYLNPD